MENEMKKILATLAIFLFLTNIIYAQNDKEEDKESIIGLSFFIQSNKKELAISFGVTFDMIRITKNLSLGADWSVYNSKNQKGNLLGWCFRFTFDKLTIPIGYDFNNQKFYIGLGAKF